VSNSPALLFSVPFSVFVSGFSFAVLRMARQQKQTHSAAPHRFVQDDHGKRLSPCQLLGSVSTIAQGLALCIERFSGANGFGTSFALLYAKQRVRLKATNRSSVYNS
jgi:hypothetical protein